MLREFDIRRAARAGTAALALIAGGACQDLQVTNLVDADRERATGNPTDVQAFIGGAFYPTFFNANHTNSQALYLFPIAGAEFVSTMSGANTLLFWEDVLEPRRPHDNGAILSVGNGPAGPRNFWADVHRSNTVAYDGLQLLNTGTVIREGTVDVTPRARAFAKFMQGWTWGYLSLMFDRAHVVPENVDIPADPSALRTLTMNSLVPADSVLAASLNALDEAIRIARANPNVVRYPSFTESTLWFGSATPVTNAQFIQWANTLAARILVLHARTPAERQTKVNWQRVLSYTANGISTPANDFNFQLSSARTSTLLLRMQNSTVQTYNSRWHYRTIGLGDQSGAYQAWMALPVDRRDRFNIVTPDRRITGLTPTSDGSYTRYRADNNGFEPDRGRYLYGAYQWQRHAIRTAATGTNTNNNAGTHAFITSDENGLLRAEALLRTGDRAGAATLINVTRTRQQRIGTTNHDGLPPVTAAGVPTVAGACVPRLDSGACGDLLTAIRYERMIELAATDAIRGYMDARGFGVLPDGSLVHWPVPGNVLDLYGMEYYTYGGVGNPNTATYRPAVLP
jgi:hypothetical protein